ncbi:hypothetical protein [Mycobacterium paragordonae]|uniref:Uncharacterized protein n=1 Tax=Mycobacterium paragordonae TaxID=1389713 RepID=A0AAJ1SBL8_9MYCO|nr:hypothetical protein [Mycobacterium paragordonae]MDP7739567.1 hypothetical protein [Mycobacterium paragordonae]
MARYFDMDPEATRAGLSNADAAAASQPGSSGGGLQPGGYMMSLTGAVSASVAVRQAEAEVQVAANTTSREVSVATVQAAEAANSSALST